MKQLLFLFAIFMVSFSSFGQCPAPEVAPWTEDFEAFTVAQGFASENCWTGTNAPSFDWNIDAAGSTPSTGTGPSNGANSGTNYFYTEGSSGTAGAQTILTSPLIDVTALTTPQLQFYYHMFGVDMGDLIVEAWDGVVWTQVDIISGQQQTVGTDPWLLREVPLVGYTGTIQIRLTGVRGPGFTSDISIDDVSIVEAPTCLTPTALSALVISATEADLSWTDNSGAGLSNIEYGVSGFVQGTGTLITGSTNNPESITGLSPVTTYEFYVQTDCGGGDLSGWAGPFSFTTPCATFIAPWTDDIEAHTAAQGITSSNCWNATAPGVYDWNITGTGTTPSTGTGPNNANSGSKFFYIEASTSNTGPAVLTSPDIDVTALTLPMLEFYYHMFGSVTGDLAIEAWDGSTWNVVDNINGQQQTAQTDPWERRVVYLPGYTGVIQIRFTATGSGSFQYGDISIDDVSLLEAPSCPEPSMFAVTSSDLTSADLAWMAGPTGETEWQLEYGTPGFIPETGAGTDIITMANPETISGLTSNSFYEVYLQGVCAPGDTSALVGPIIFNTYNQGLYMEADTDCGPGFNDISATGVVNLLGDDGEVGVTLPFPLLYQGALVNDATIGSNGAIVFGTQTAQVGFTNGNMAGAADGLYPFWDDLGPEETAQGEGVFYETIGTAPNQQFIVQWNKDRLGGDGTYIFQLTIDEATQEMWYAYDVVDVAEPSNDYGIGATIGAAGPTNDVELSFNNAQYLTDNSCAHFYYTNCPTPLNYTVVYTTNDEGAISWNAGLASETDWTVIYGPEGFDPMVSGTTINTTSPAAIFPGLDDITTYDVYIYADCNPGVLQSNDLFGQFTTLPNCSDPTAFNATSATDTIFSDWSWTESSGIGTYPSTGFNTQYGMMGFDLYDGNHTIVNADNDFTDTTEDMTLLGGGVYEVYVQAVCGTDTSNWVGPVSIVMPLTNDSTCNAIDLMVDGSVYVFNNSTATSQLNENNLAPPTTGAQTTDGWAESNISNSTWFTFTAPASGQMALVGTDVVLDGQMAVYETTDCANVNAFNFIAGNDDQIDGTSPAPDFTLCGLTPGNQYYLLYDGYLGANGNYSIALSEIVVEAGTTNGIIDVCTGDTANLFTGLTGYDMGGTWTQEIATIGFADSIFPSAGVAYQVYNFEYEVVWGCAYDTIIQQVQIYGPSNAGTDGTMTVCQNEPINLLTGLGGNVDLGGTWYDPANNALPNGAITASNIPGQFNYDYITSNGVCPEDTANVVVNVDAGCDYLNLEEVYFGAMDIYPNPTSGMIYISNNGSTETFNYELTDVKGKVVATAKSAINGTELTEINLANLEPGVYMIQVYNDNAAKTFRIVKQ